MDPRALPAFPTTEQHGFNNGEPGMTLYAYFAAAALQGLLSNPAIIDTLNRSAFDVVVSAAVTTANMLLERVK